MLGPLHQLLRVDILGVAPRSGLLFYFFVVFTFACRGGFRALCLVAGDQTWLQPARGKRDVADWGWYPLDEELLCVFIFGGVVLGVVFALVFYFYFYPSSSSWSRLVAHF